MTRQQKSAAAIGAVLILLLIPIPYLASLKWTVTVTDEAGHPLQGMVVRLDYENYSVENSSHGFEQLTSASGRAVFPRQTRIALMMTRCYFTPLSANGIRTCQLRPSAYVPVFGKDREGSVNSADGSVFFWKDNRIGLPRLLSREQGTDGLYSQTISVASRSFIPSRRRMSRWLFPSTKTSAGRSREL